MDSCRRRFFSFVSGGVGPIPTAYMATAALILVGSIIENSYFLAYHDELTTLPGRRAYNDALLNLEEPYAVAVVDIDHFKKFNDTYGHETGDQVLRLVATKLAEVTGGGRAYRVGGEEFSILFPGKSVKAVLPHLESLRSTIETSRFQLRREQERREQERRRQESQTDPSREAEGERVGERAGERSGERARKRSVNGEARNVEPRHAGLRRQGKKFALLGRVRLYPRTTSSR